MSISQEDKRAAKKRKAVEAAQMEEVEDDAQTVANSSVQVEQEQEDVDEPEVEVLSHAEQRKRRKLDKKKASSRTVDGGLKESEAASTSTKPAAAVNEAQASRQSKSSFGIWVGNLAFKTDADKLKEFFSLCGTITRVNMPKGAQFKGNKGFAYVDFDTREAMTEAIAMSEENLDGRRLLIKDASDYKGRPKNENAAAAEKALLGGDNAAGTGGASASQTPSIDKTLSKSSRKILDRQKNPPAPTLFLGNLGYDATIETIQEAFEARAENRSKWTKRQGGKRDRKGKGKESGDESEDTDSEDAVEGDGVDEDGAHQASSAPGTTDKGGKAGIRKVRIGTFEDSGKCKGWAFVDFYTTNKATESLVDGNNHYLNGRTLTVEFASADAVRRGGGRMDGTAAEGDDKATARGGKRKRDDQDSRRRPDRKAPYDGAPAVQTPAQEEELPQQAFYRPPLPAQPFKDVAVKTHKPNKAERQALREDRQTKEKRKKPGAALASAPRETMAIQPSQGKKITFN